MRHTPLLTVLLAMACKDPRGDSVPGETKSTWFEPGFFIAWASTGMVDELHADLGGGGMHVVNIQWALEPSVSLADYLQRLADDADLHHKLESSKATGASVVVQIQGMPRWLSSTPNDSSLLCPDEPTWPAWSTRAPAAGAMAAWQDMVEQTVRYLVETRGYDQLAFQLWDEPDGVCFWRDTEQAYLDLFIATAEAVQRVGPAGRFGGPGASSLRAVIEPSTTPLVQAVILRAAAAGIALDFTSFHIFESSPHIAKLYFDEVGRWLDEAGHADVPIWITSYNPNESDRSDFWPSPPTPSALGTWEPDNEVGAAYAVAFSSALAATGRRGYHAMYELDDADTGGEFPGQWGARTPLEQNALRKPIYQASMLMGRMPDAGVPVELTDATAGSDGALGPLGAIAGMEPTELSVLVWSFIAAPNLEARAVVIEAGFPNGLQTWPADLLPPFFSGQAPVSSITSEPAEQAALEKAKRVFLRQRGLVGRNRQLCIDIGVEGTVSDAVFVDAVHNNTYAAYTNEGLAAAIAADELRSTPSLVTRDGTCWRVELEQYAVARIKFSVAQVPSVVRVGADN